MHAFLSTIQFASGVALLIWASRLVRAATMEGLGRYASAALLRATQRRIYALFAGVAASLSLQSSTTAGLVLAPFVERAYIALPMGLAALLGADIGSALVVQLLFLNVPSLGSALVILAALLSQSRRALTRSLASAFAGAGLMILALGMIVAESGPVFSVLASSQDALAAMTNPLVCVLLGLIAAWLSHSAIAIILVIASLTTTGAIGAETALALMIGANVGSAAAPAAIALRAGPVSRRLFIGNLCFRALGALVALPLIAPISQAWATTGFAADRLVVIGFLALSLVIAAMFLPWVLTATRILESALPTTRQSNTEIGHLDETLLLRPALALAAATRETIKLSDVVEQMLKESISAFETDGGKRLERLRAADDQIDRLQEGVKRYLARLLRQSLTAAESRRAYEIIMFATNLEHVGDVIDHGLLRQAHKKHRLNVYFSESGWREIEDMHARLINQMRLAVVVFLTRDIAAARQIAVEKDAIREAEREGANNHLRRLRDGMPATLESSTLHLDILRDLKRINAHLTAVAYPVLEEQGALRSTRLRDFDHADNSSTCG